MKQIFSLLLNIIIFIILFIVTLYLFAYITTIKTYSSEKIGLGNFSIAVINKDTNNKEVIKLKNYIKNNKGYYLLRKASTIKAQNGKKDDFFLLKIDNDIYQLTHYSDDFKTWINYSIVNNIVKPISSHGIDAIMSLPSFFITILLFYIILLFKRKLILKYKKKIDDTEDDVNLWR